jgi:hypothetical protein
MKERNELEREYDAWNRKGRRKKRMERAGEKERVWQWKRMTVNKRTETMNEKQRVSRLDKNGKERVW